MADEKLTALTPKTSPADTDILYIVDDPSGTPVSKKITRAELLADRAGDRSYDSSGNNVTAGHVNNAIANDVTNGVIGGGGNSTSPNRIGTTASTGANVATIGGGYDNDCDHISGTIAGGSHHTLGPSGDHGTVGGGSTNVISDGSYGVIAGGNQNTVTGTQAAVGGGTENEASAVYSTVVGGARGTASEVGATVLGGQDNQATGVNSAAMGHEADARHRCGLTLGAGKFAAVGDAQVSAIPISRQSTNATPQELRPEQFYRLTIPSDTTWAFSALVVARRADADGESAAYKLEGCIANDAGTTRLVGSVTKTVIAEDTEAWDVSATADDANDALSIKGTGEAGKTINWVARVELAEVMG